MTNITSKKDPIVFLGHDSQDEDHHYHRDYDHKLPFHVWYCDILRAFQGPEVRETRVTQVHIFWMQACVAIWAACGHLNLVSSLIGGRLGFKCTYFPLVQNNYLYIYFFKLWIFDVSWTATKEMEVPSLANDHSKHMICNPMSTWGSDILIWTFN